MAKVVFMECGGSMGSEHCPSLHCVSDDTGNGYQPDEESCNMTMTSVYECQLSVTMNEGNGEKMNI